jgi:hypothetical protein
MEMIRIHPIRFAALTAAFALTCSLPALADDMVSFATAGYASGLRTPEVMHKIDTDGDGTVSHEEYIAYQSKVFDMMDTSTSHKGMLGKEEMLATGGGNRSN